VQPNSDARLLLTCRDGVILVPLITEPALKASRLAILVSLAFVSVTPSFSASPDQATAPVQPTAEAEDLARARAILGQVPLIDGHNDLPWALRQKVRYDLMKLDIASPQPSLMTDIGRLREGKVGAQFWSVYVPSSLQGEAAVTATLEQIDVVHLLARRYPKVFEIARTSDDVERAFKAGRIASLVGMEGGHSIDSSLGTLRAMHRLGARYLTLTHGKNTPWADSATDTPAHGGLTRFGEEIVREMNRLGMLVDLSHVSPGTMDDALNLAAAPVIFSHSSARALCDVARNVPDAILRRLPKNGGVVMVTFVPGFISTEVANHDKALDAHLESVRKAHPDDETAVKQARGEWLQKHPAPRATLAQVADHIDHVRKVAGIDHIGIGSDFDGIDTVPVGLEDVSKYPALFAELARRGYSDSDLKKVAGLNVLRVMRTAEDVGSKLHLSRAPSVATIEQLDGKAPATRELTRP
jgi:membrane dipeptidase